MADYDNTPPTAKALTGMTPDNTAPVGQVLSFTPDNTAPGTKTIDQAPSNTAPTAKALAGVTPDETAPVGIAINQALSNTAPAGKALSGFTPDNTAPGTKAIDQVPSNSAPTAKALAGVTPDETAPVGIAINQALSNTAPVGKALGGFMPDNTAPSGVDLTTPSTPNNAAAVPITAAPISNITMPASFQPAFVDLTGGGNCLDSLMATAADIGKILQGTVDGELKSYQVRAHAGTADLPGIVLPANHDPVTNAVAFYQAGL